MEKEKLFFKAMCQQASYLKGIGRPCVTMTLADVSSKFSKLIDDKSYYLVLDSLFDYGKQAKQLYAIMYSLERTGLIKVIKGNSKRATKVQFTEKGINYIKSLRTQKERA